jgi:hypothetical protein
MMYLVYCLLKAIHNGSGWLLERLCDWNNERRYR